MGIWSHGYLSISLKWHVTGHSDCQVTVVKSVLVKGVNGNKIDITLTKLDVGLSWKTLGRGLQGHNQLHKEKARGEYVVFAGCDCKQLHKKKARGEYVVFAGCNCNQLRKEKARSEYVVFAGCDCKQLHKEKVRREYVVFTGCDCKLLLSDMKKNLKIILRYFLQLNLAIV